MNFDQRLRAMKTQEEYHWDKVKGGRAGSKAGQSSPTSRANIRIARLYSPRTVGQSLTVTPLDSYLHFRIGHYYEWRVTEPALGYIDGIMVEADEIKKHFKVIPKGDNGKKPRTLTNHQTAGYSPPDLRPL